MARARHARLGALLLALATAPAWGLSSDREQPIQIEADRASLDEGEGISVYEGNVELRQGTLQLSGQRMTVYLKDKQVFKVELTGQPASYSQRFDGEDTDQRAEAGRIEYRTAEQRMILLQNARIWREQAEEFSSDRIVINLRDNTLNAGGEGPSGRVRIILQPQTWQTGEEQPGQ
ncbi:MAG: lipopolysaccharide transport periplasmic protein LptA [Thiohalobacterales bacterium]|nr:lipopolysaccharide transport periplasmic protein LptA [Thiohalobacterales bacterium]